MATAIWSAAAQLHTFLDPFIIIFFYIVLFHFASAAIPLHRIAELHLIKSTNSLLFFGPVSIENMSNEILWI